MSNYHSTDDSEAGSLASDSSSLYQLENEPLLKMNSDYESTQKRSKWSLVAGGIFVALLFVLAVSTGRQILPFGTSKKSQSLSSSSYTISVASKSPGYGPLRSVDMLPWDVVLEPNREQELEVTTLTVDDETVDFSDFDIEWTINDDITLTGAKATIEMSDVGVYSATVKLTSTTATYTSDFLVAVKYVRREVRTMTEDDRKTFFDALYTMYTVDGDSGRDKFGSKYIDASEAVYMHLNGAGRTDCDHWHDGAGLITHHMAYTLQVEQSLQTINPSISMPYWEYGMDAYLYDNWMDSPIFNADWFGEANPNTADHSIGDGGRWTHLQMPSADDYMDWDISEEGSLNPFANGFGLMRGPWNNNPSTTLGRHNTTYGKSSYTAPPDCSSLSSCFSSRSLSEINNCLNGATHGPVHILIGGGWDDVDIFNSNNTNGIEIKGLQSSERVLLFKLLWRMGYTRCPTACTGTTHSDCKCSVPDEYIDEYGAEAILKASNAYYPISSHLEGADNETLLTYLRAIEDPGVMGEMLSSAASFDPTFWPLHGAMERLLDLKRIYVAQGVITNFDETWGFPSYNKYDQAAYLDGICDWSSVSSNDDLTLPSCDLGVTCTGHNQYDELEFSNFLNKGETYTNWDFFNLLHPWNDSLPYTYDTFDFDYCNDVGFPFRV